MSIKACRTRAEHFNQAISRLRENYARKVIKIALEMGFIFPLLEDSLVIRHFANPWVELFLEREKQWAKRSAKRKR